MDPIPSEPSSGPAGTQQAETSDTELAVVDSVFPSEILTDTLVGLAIDDDRSFGGRAAAKKMGIAILRRKELDAQRCQADLAKALSELSIANAELFSCKTKLALMKQRAADGVGIQIFQLFAVSIGFSLITLAVDLYKGPAAVITGHIVLGMGAGLVLFGWVWTLIDHLRNRGGQ